MSRKIDGNGPSLEHRLQAPRNDLCQRSRQVCSDRDGFGQRLLPSARHFLPRPARPWEGKPPSDSYLTLAWRGASPRPKSAPPWNICRPRRPLPAHMAPDSAGRRGTRRAATWAPPALNVAVPAWAYCTGMRASSSSATSSAARRSTSTSARPSSYLRNVFGSIPSRRRTARTRREQHVELEIERHPSIPDVSV